MKTQQAMNTFCIRFILLFSLLTSVKSVVAQDTLTTEKNLIRTGDRLYKSAVSGIGAGASGNNVSWNYANARVSDTEHIVDYYDDDGLLKTESGKINKFIHSGDTVYMTSVEDRLRVLSFARSLPCIAYPFTYGDSITSTFSGRGLYCGTRHVNIKGSITVKADAYGELLLPDDLHYSDVLRVCTQRVADIRLCHDSAAIDSVSERTEVLTRYDWYAHGYRYPLLELAEYVSYDGDKPVASRKEAYITRPDKMDCGGDMVNEAVRRTVKAYSNDSGDDGICKKRGIVNYDVSVNGSSVDVTYTIDRTSDISLIVSDFAGIVYHSEHQPYSNAGTHSHTFDCGNMRAGRYIVYIQTSNNTVSKKFTLK